METKKMDKIGMIMPHSLLKKLLKEKFKMQE